ncbi:PAS domain S-box protein [Halolamina sp. C58]|uniref:PAS domain S-box protein n=1 Tax=Halolamina sp. C58 TaxID=3421640 RepID=UPI003EC08DB4
MQTPPDRIRVLHVEGSDATVGAELGDADDRLDVTTTARAEAARSLLEDEAFDCVAAAGDLPDATGVELLERVREREPTLPFVMYAAEGSETLASDATAAGVTDYVPLDAGVDLPARVVDAVEREERRRRTHRRDDGEDADPTTWELTPAEYRDIFVEAEVGIAITDPETGTFEHVNRRWAEMLGYEPGTIQGMRVDDVSADDEGFDQSAAMARIRAAIEGTPQQFDWLHERADGTPLWCEVNLKRARIGGEQRLLAFLRDASERKEQEERFRAFVEQSNDILTILDQNGVYQYQSPSVERILGYEPDALLGKSAFDYVHPDDRGRVVAAFREALEQPDRDLTVEYRFRHADGSWRWVESRGATAPANSAVEGFVVNTRDVTERKRHERQIAELHDATREMVGASDETELCEIAVETAETVLGHSIAGVWLADESEERLEPLAITDAARELFGDIPVYAPGNSLSWRAYEDGESLVVDDMAAASDQYNPDSPIGSELVVPLGEYGVLNVGAEAAGAFDDNDVMLVKLLAANAEVALDRSERESQLERQTEQMEFFNSILRHDVLNAVTVIRARAEFLAEDLEGDQLDDVETIVRWSDDVTEIVQRVRTVLETLTREDDPELEPIDVGAELRAEVERVRATYPEVAFDTEIPEGMPVRANELLGDVLGNIVTNAIEHNDTEGLSVSVRAGRVGDEIAVRIADNGQGVDDDRKEAIFRRGVTGHAKSIGSGFGLFFADAMVAEYGGDLWVEDNDAGGATFVIRLPAADADSA